MTSKDQSSNTEDKKEGSGDNNNTPPAKKLIFRVNVFYKQNDDDGSLLDYKVGCIFVQALDLDKAQERGNKVVQQTLAERKLKVPYKLTTSLSSQDEMNFFCANKSTPTYNGVLN